MTAINNWETVDCHFDDRPSAWTERVVHESGKKRDKAANEGNADLSTYIKRLLFKHYFDAFADPTIHSCFLWMASKLSVHFPSWMSSANLSSEIHCVATSASKDIQHFQWERSNMSINFFP